MAKTCFQSIQEELTSLGWVMARGKGDHVKFTHPDKKGVITASISVGRGNKSYENLLGDIRRVEPDFKLGRPTPKKQVADEQSEESAAERVVDEAFANKMSQYGVDSIITLASEEGRGFIIDRIQDTNGSVDAIMHPEDIVTVANIEDSNDVREVFASEIVGFAKQESQEDKDFSVEKAKEEISKVFDSIVDTYCAASHNDELKQLFIDQMIQLCMNIFVNDSDEFRDIVLNAIRAVNKKKCATERAKSREISRSVNKEIQKITQEVYSLNLSSVPTFLLIKEALDRLGIIDIREQVASTLTDKEVLEMAMQRKLAFAIEQDDEFAEQSKSPDITQITSTVLYGELKRRGFVGDMKRVVEEVLS